MDTEKKNKRVVEEMDKAENGESFEEKEKLFKEKVINNSNGPLGKVIDWWDRKEFQAMGAIHNHMVNRCRKDKCFTSSHDKPLRKCKYGFPYPVQEEEGLNNDGNRFLPRRRCHEDILVVSYNQEILYLCGAHMNIQKDDDNSDEEDTSDVCPAVLVDRMGRRWKQRKVEAVARWRFYLPNGENQESYYMQKLVLNLPLRKETPVISPNNMSKT
eukprot:gene16123-7480_t